MTVIIRKFAHFCQRLFSQIAHLPKYVNNFGIKVALYIIVDRLFPPGRSKRYQKVVYQYLHSEFSDIVNEGYNEDYNKTGSTQTDESVRTIWVCWFQGEENMPELVRMCYKNLQNKIAGSEINLTLLTYQNIDQYVEIPNYIKEKYHNGIISNAHYSDILRVKLLRKYGGCWMDATIFATDYIPDDLFEKQFHTLKMHPELCPSEPCLGLWSFFFLAGQKGFALFNIIDDCLDRYWRKHTEAIDYIMTDYIMLAAYRNNPEVRDVMDSVPYNNERLWLLWNNLENPFDDRLYQEIWSNGQFYKLSYQKILNKEVNGRQTFYGYLTSHH